MKRNPFVRVTVGKETQDSTMQKDASDPCWNENFQFLVYDPQRDVVTFQVETKIVKNFCSFHF
jgi:Ca2+-dependent lipid-binding protein